MFKLRARAPRWVSVHELWPSCALFGAPSVFSRASLSRVVFSADTPQRPVPHQPQKPKLRTRYWRQHHRPLPARPAASEPPPPANRCLSTHHAARWPLHWQGERIDDSSARQVTAK